MMSSAIPTTAGMIGSDRLCHALQMGTLHKKGDNFGNHSDPYTTSACS